MTTGEPNGPAAAAAAPERLTAKQVGEKLSKSKRCIHNWACEEPNPCPSELGPDGRLKLFELAKVREWAIARGYISANAPTSQISSPAPAIPDPVAPAGPATNPDDAFDRIDAALDLQLTALLGRKPTQVGDQVIVDPKLASALKNLLGEWRRLREQRFEESVRQGKTIDRRVSERMLLGLLDVLFASCETLQLETARVIVDLSSSPEMQRNDREGIERLARAAARPMVDRLRARLKDHVDKQLGAA